jgi:hypothetical protein
MIQVALLGLAKSFQKDLNEIAEKVEASNQRWYKFILTGSADSEFFGAHVLLTICASLQDLVLFSVSLDATCGKQFLV